MQTVTAWLRGLTKASTSTVTVISSVMIAAMMFLTVADVSLRSLLNKPIKGSYELMEEMMLMACFLALAYCEAQKGHIRVSFIIDRLPAKARAWFDIVTDFFSLIVYALLVWQIFSRALELRNVGQITGLLSIPIFPFILVAFAGCVAMCLELLRSFVGSVGRLRTPKAGA